MLLLQHGADVDATTKDMYTPLHIAAKEGQDEVHFAFNHSSLNLIRVDGCQLACLSVLVTQS